MSIGDSWKNVLCKMKKGELLSIVDEHEDYSTDLVAVAKEVLKEKAIINAEKNYNNLLDDLKNGKKRYEKRVEDCKMRMMKERRRRYRVGMRNAVQRDRTEITGCRDLLLDTLDRMGFAYQTEKDDSIRLEYSIDTFYAEADNEHPYVTLFYYSWKSIDLEGGEYIDEMLAVSKAINNANWENRVVTVFTIDEEEKTMNVHCKSEFLFIPEIPDLENYLITELSNLLRM